MGILTKEVEVRVNGKHIKYYQNLGYEIPKKISSKDGKTLVADYSKTITVKIEDLPLRSDIYVQTQCDYCGKLKPPIKYSDYNTQTKNGTLKCCCLDCAAIKREESMIERYGYGYAMQNPEMKEHIQKTNLERYGSISPSGNADVRAKQRETSLNKYGVENPLQSKEVQDKIKQTFLDKYGVENPLLNSTIREKVAQTTLERYGVENVLFNKETRNKINTTLIERYGTQYPLQNKECFEKLKQTNLERYGVENISQLEEVKQKKIQTSLEKYGCEYPMQSPEILEKWFKKYGSNFVKYSRQQQYLCSLYGGILNYPFKCFALDVYIPEDKIDIEFDGSGHKMSISFNSVTKEEFEQKELYRNVALKKEGYKQMRIISTKDLLPSDQILLQMLEQTRKYFSDYPSHSWIEFNIDTSTVRNAEQEDGVFFDFGELRRIKKSDVENLDENVDCA